MLSRQQELELIEIHIQTKGIKILPPATPELRIETFIKEIKGKRDNKNFGRNYKNINKRN